MFEFDWPFDQPRNCAAITLKSIAFAAAPILMITHDEDDHGWQFLDGNPVEEDDATVVALEEIVAMDPTVLEIADLPPGWVAWRETVNSPWERAINDDSEYDEDE